MADIIYSGSNLASPLELRVIERGDTYIFSAESPLGSGNWQDVNSGNSVTIDFEKSGLEEVKIEVIADPSTLADAQLMGTLPQADRWKPEGTWSRRIHHTVSNDPDKKEEVDGNFGCDILIGNDAYPVDPGFTIKRTSGGGGK